MRKIIAIGGEPAVGKTTILTKFLSSVSWEEAEPEKLVSSMYNKENDLYVLGKYAPGEMFAGTDKLSMAVQPNATKFIKESKSNVLFEGDRLFNQSFLEVLADIEDIELDILFVTAKPETIDFRHVDRKDTQSEQFIRGRKTKYENLRSSFVLMPYVKVFENNTQEDLEKIVSFLKEKLYK